MFGVKNVGVITAVAVTKNVENPHKNKNM